MYIDTHTHLYLDQFESDRDQIIQNAIASGVEKMLLPNIDVKTIASMHTLMDKYPSNCYGMMGLHPGSVKENYEEKLSVIEQHLFSRNYIAVGEIGIDLYWDKTFLPQQIEVFQTQVQWAKQLGLPIIIHAREAFNEIFEVLDKMHDVTLTGIFHCFTGTLEQAQKAIDYSGFKLGIGGVLTYPKAELDKIIATIDLKHLVLETDSPYLPPVPYRGKRNESSYIPFIAEKLAEVHGVTLATIEAQTTANALELFPTIK